MPERILMIDDCVEMCEEVSEFLRDEGFEVDTVHDGIAGEEFLLRSRYDLVLLDLKMPGLDGLSLLRRFRQRDADTRVIVVTAHPVVSDLQKSEGGLDGDERDTLMLANGIVGKPYNLERLLATIREKLGTKSPSATSSRP